MDLKPKVLEGIAIFHRSVRKHSLIRWHFEQGSEGDTDRVPCTRKGKKIPGIDKSMCKGPKVETFLTYFLTCRDANVTEVKRV